MNIVCLVGVVIKINEETLDIDVSNPNVNSDINIVTIPLPDSHKTNRIVVNDLVGIKAQIKTERDLISLVYQKFDIL